MVGISISQLVAIEALSRSLFGLVNGLGEVEERLGFKRFGMVSPRAPTRLARSAALKAGRASSLGSPSFDPGLRMRM